MSINDLSIIDTAALLEPVEQGAIASGVTLRPIANAKVAQILSPQELSALNVRSNRQGIVQLAKHLSVMGISGYLWGANLEHWYLAIPALVLYGCTLSAMFAPMHECSHRTAFANNRANDIVSWLAGLLSFYNSTFYRRYHKWHHRYTQIPDKDPELSGGKPSNLREYLVEISGLPWWFGKLKGHLRVACGQLDDCPFIPETARAEVIRSVRLQLAVYVSAIALSFAIGQPWFLLYWLLPLALGQPMLRMLLLSEHTGCSNDDNSLTNTRTTLTNSLMRLLTWNISFHAEHHLYASIPFHALPLAHEKLQGHFAHVEGGYLNINRNFIATLGQGE